MNKYIPKVGDTVRELESYFDDRYAKGRKGIIEKIWEDGNVSIRLDGGAYDIATKYELVKEKRGRPKGSKKYMIKFMARIRLAFLMLHIIWNGGLAKSEIWSKKKALEEIIYD